jgi:hypothetical protein
MVRREKFQRTPPGGHTFPGFRGLLAEVTFDFKHQSCSPAFGIFCLIGEHLLGKGIHASTALTASHGPEDCDPGEKTTLRDNEPLRSCRRLRALGMMELADYQIMVDTTCRRDLWCESHGPNPLFPPHHKDVYK